MFVALGDLGAGDHALGPLLQPADAGLGELGAVGAADDPQTGSFADCAECSHGFQYRSVRRITLLCESPSTCVN